MFWEIYIPKEGEKNPELSISKTEVTLIPSIKCDQYKNNTLHKQNFEKLFKRKLYNHIFRYPKFK